MFHPKIKGARLKLALKPRLLLEFHSEREGE
jgi:hypothetical protein